MGPAALTECADRVSVSGRHARVIGVSRYPARLHPGWLGDLQGFEGDLDLALHIWPSRGPAVMSFLERRTGELSSTLRPIDAPGRPPDPSRPPPLPSPPALHHRLADALLRL